MQFALYIDKIIERIEMQKEAYSKEEDIPDQLFDVYAKQKNDLEQLREKHGAVVPVDKLA